MNNDVYGDNGNILNMLFWIILLGFLFYGILLLILKPFENNGDTSIQILKEKFTRGEIDVQEFEEKKNILRNKAKIFILTISTNLLTIIKVS